MKEGGREGYPIDFIGNKFFEDLINVQANQGKSKYSTIVKIKIKEM
jgi:hypothetical protein